MPTRLYTIILQKTVFFILECSLLRISTLTDVIALRYMYKEMKWHSSEDAYQSVWLRGLIIKFANSPLCTSFIMNLYQLDK